MEIRKHHVDIRLNSAPTPQELRAEGYDAIIAAIGSVPVIPDNIEGLRDENGKALYPTCHDIFMKKPELGRHVVIIGGSMTGMETAIYLLEKGHDVTMLTRQDRVAHDNDVPMHYITMAYTGKCADGKYHARPAWEKYDNFHPVVNATTLRVNNGMVTYKDKDGNEHNIRTDSVVLNTGTKALTDEALQYSGITSRFYIIGACNHSGNIQKCTREAYASAMHI